MANVKKRRRKRRRMTTKERLISAAVIIVGFAAVMLMGGKMLMDWHPMDKLGQITNDLPYIGDSNSNNEGKTSEDKSAEDGFVNILCMGFDEEETLTDVMMLVSLNKATNQVSILQIPRDTYVEVGATGKMNQVYSQAGDEASIQNVVKVINEKFYLSVDHYVTIGCDDIVEIVDKIGGIPIDVPERIIYAADKIIEPGEQVLDGEQAEWFVRYRKAYAMGDLGRAHTQRIFLAACMKKAKDLGLSQVVSLIPSVYTNVSTDMSVGQMSDMAKLFINVDLANCNMYMLPGEAVDPGVINDQYLYLMHKQEIADMLNLHFRNADEPVDGEYLDIKGTEYYGIESQTNAYDDDSSNFQSIIDGDVPEVDRVYLPEYDLY